MKADLTISFGSTMRYVEMIEELSQTLGRMCGFDDDSRYWIGLSVRESVTNAIHHGNRMDEGKQVEVRFESLPDRLIICVLDEGEGFDLEELPDPTAPENLLRPCGRGVFYMRSFMDRVSYEPRPGGGLELRMEKRLAHKEGVEKMNIETRESEGVVILDVSGKITIGEGSREIRAKVKECLESGKKSILLNLGQVSYVDSSGIGELVSAYTTVGNQGGQLKLLNLTGKIQELLAITKLLTVFDCFDDEAKALASF